MLYPGLLLNHNQAEANANARHCGIDDSFKQVNIVSGNKCWERRTPTPILPRFPHQSQSATRPTCLHCDHKMKVLYISAHHFISCIY